jgi:nucleoside-diphosphate-sugar epimerase
MRILITGSSGYLGSAIAQLLSINHEPIGIDIAPGRWTQRIVDITDRSLVGKLVRGMDAIIHTASLHQPHLATHSSRQFLAVNVTGTLNLLAGVIHARVPALELLFARQGWKLPTSIDRVYVIERARQQIRYNPVHNFSEYLQEIECT